MLCVLCCRWDTTSLSDSPSSLEQSPSDVSPTCEMLLQQHEQQQAAAPLPRMDKALGAHQAQQQQHEAGALHVRQTAQGLLLQEQEEECAQELQLGLQQQPFPLKKPKGE